MRLIFHPVFFRKVKVFGIRVLPEEFPVTFVILVKAVHFRRLRLRPVLAVPAVSRCGLYGDILRLRRDRLRPLSSVHGLLRHVYGLMELYGLRHGLRCLHGLSGRYLTPLFRIRMRVSRSSVRSILDRRGRLCILYRLRRLLLRYVLGHGSCRFRLENQRLSVLPA